MGKPEPRNTVIIVPTWFIWLFLVSSTLLNVPKAAHQVIRWLYPYEDATTQCRLEAKGSLGIEMQGGILCLRPVHFIQDEYRPNERADQDS